VSIDRKIILPGSETYWSGYEKAEELEKLFPEQDAYDFCSAIAENQSVEPGPLTDEVGITGLLLVQQGENDSESWIWLVKLSNGEHWWLDGWCDYTGWDCQSGIAWNLWEDS
jgi:hypothetical protein